MRQKRIALFFLGASGVCFSIGTLGYPVQKRSQTTQEGQTYTIQTYERKWELLPLSEWSVLPCEICSRSKYGGMSTHMLPFLFFALKEKSASYSYTTAEWKQIQQYQGKKP